MPGRTTTKPETTPAGAPAPEPVEEVQPTAPAAPAPEPTEGPDTPSGSSSANAGRLTSKRRTLFGEAEFPLSVGEAITEVTARIGAIEKTGRSTEGYRFRGIDQALAALHPILADVGLVIMPGKVVRETWETRATSKGGTLNVARLLVRYRLIGPDGSEAFAVAWGEGGDSGDKATQKAHSQSFKTMVFQTFTIPTEESAADEPDASGEPARPFTPDEVERAGRAANAGQEADTVEKLAGVRQRALALLSVPVQMVDGSLVPLSVLFDQRRAQLERAGGDQQ
jgi:hypothetical protein